MMAVSWSSVAASPKAGMSIDNPYAAPPARTMPVHSSSVSDELLGQDARAAAGTARRVIPLDLPFASAPWQELHHFAYRTAPVSAGDRSTTAASRTSVTMVSP